MVRKGLIPTRMFDFGFSPFPTAAAYLQAHQAGREDAEVFDLPGVSISQPDLCGRDKCPLAFAAAIKEHLSIAKLVIFRPRAVAQFIEVYVALVKNGQLCAILPLSADDGVGCNADVVADGNPSGLHVRGGL